jgi:hypothetical protein
MSNLVTVQRVTVVADSKLEADLLKQIARLGAKGYTCEDCRGRGEHEILQDVFSGASRVRIETIVQPTVAEAIMAYLDAPQFHQQALTACAETVQVLASDRF